MTCDQRQDALMLYALGALDDIERHELRRHLDGGCPKCAGALVEAETTLAQLPLDLPAVAPPAEARRRLLERVAGEPVPRVIAERGPAAAATVRRGGRRAWLVAAAVMVVSVAGAGLLWRQASLSGLAERQAARIAELESSPPVDTELQATVARQAAEIERLKDVVDTASDVLAIVEIQRRDIERLEASLAETRAAADRREERIRELQRTLDDSATRVATYTSPDVRVFSLSGTDAATEASARVFWNRPKRRWDFYASGLAPAGLVRTYQLWFLTAAGEKVSAGTFDVDDDGEARLLDVQVPRGLGVLSAAAVTDEPIGGSLQPTGTIRLVGELPGA